MAGIDIRCSHRTTGMNYTGFGGILIRECITCYCTHKDVIKWAGPKARKDTVEISSILVCLDCPHRIA